MNSKLSYDDSQKSSRKSLFIWTLLWLISFAISTFGTILIWDKAIVPSIIAILISTFLGFKMLQANWKNIKAQDEMYQKINLEAIAKAFGFTFLIGFTLFLLYLAEITSMDVNMSIIAVVMSITYILALVIGQRAYR